MRKLKVLFVSLFIAMTVSMFSSCTMLALFKVGQELSLWVSLPGTWHEVDNSGNIVARIWDNVIIIPFYLQYKFFIVISIIVKYYIFLYN